MLINEHDYHRRRQSPFWSALCFHLVQFGRPQIWFSAESSQADSKVFIESHLRELWRRGKIIIGRSFDKSHIRENNFILFIFLFDFDKLEQSKDTGRHAFCPKTGAGTFNFYTTVLIFPLTGHTKIITRQVKMWSFGWKSCSKLEHKDYYQYKSLENKVYLHVNKQRRRESNNVWVT